MNLSKDLNSQLDRIKGQIKTDNFNNIRYLIIKLPFLIDISFDTSFVPEIEKQAELRENFEAFTGTTLFEDNKTFICFTWNKGQYFCQNFMNNLVVSKNLKNSIYSFVFDDSRELIIRKSWWDSLGMTALNTIKSGSYSDYFGSWKAKDIEIIKKF